MTKDMFCNISCLTISASVKRGLLWGLNAIMSVKHPAILQKYLAGDLDICSLLNTSFPYPSLPKKHVYGALYFLYYGY